jgi:hypothetical protein
VIVVGLFALVAGLGVFVTGGNFRRLGKVALRGEALLLVLLAAQAVARGRLLTPLSVELGWDPVVPWLVTTGALLVVLSVNLRTPGIPLAAAGTAMNLIVVALNHGMPVLTSGTKTSQVAASVAHSSSFYLLGPARLAFAGDALPGITLPGLGGAALFSAGDILLFAGVTIVIIWGATFESPTLQPGVQ